MKPIGKWLRISALCLAMSPALGHAADDFYLYNGQAAGDVTANDLPVVEQFTGAGTPYSGPSWFTAADYFPSGTYAGRIIAVTGTSVYLETAPGSGTYTQAANVNSNSWYFGVMDPAFVRVSPDGARVAIGCGYGMELLVLPTTTLAPGSAPGPDLLTDATVKVYPQMNYYDADWALDSQHLLINGGIWPGPPYGSGVVVLDTINDPLSSTGTPLLGNIGGASSGVCVDPNGNLIVGNGYAPGPPNETGEIKVFNSSEWSTSPSGILDYDAHTRVLATNILSAAYLSADAEGNVTVGGADAFGTGGAAERGYAALVKADKVVAVASGTAGAEPPVDENDGTEYKTFAPDPCQNDTATGIMAGTIPGQGAVMSVVWNPTNETCNQGAADDLWPPKYGAAPRITHYQVNANGDRDGDGFVDTEDTSYLTYHTDNRDTDGDGYGNIVDADLNNDNVVNAQDFTLFRSQYGQAGADLDADFNGDSVVNALDFTIFRSYYGTQAPWF